jgi:hypothetical protein
LVSVLLPAERTEVTACARRFLPFAAEEYVRRAEGAPRPCRSTDHGVWGRSLAGPDSTAARLPLYIDSSRPQRRQPIRRPRSPRSISDGRETHVAVPGLDCWFSRPGRARAPDRAARRSVPCPVPPRHGRVGYFALARLRRDGPRAPGCARRPRPFPPAGRRIHCKKAARGGNGNGGGQPPPVQCPTATVGSRRASRRRREVNDDDDDALP